MLSRLLFVLIALFGFAQAQTIGLQFTGSLPTGDFNQAANFGTAAGLTLQVPVGRFVATGYVGYGIWDEAENPAGSVDLKNWPVILLGARSYYGDFYLATLAGSYPAQITIKSDEGNTEKKDTYFAALFGAGYVFPVSFLDLDLSAGYLWNPEYPQVQIGLAILLFR